MIDLFGHIGYAALMIGTWMVAHKYAAGWACRAIGSATWLVLGVVMAMSSIWIWCTVFLTMDVLGFCRWKVKVESLKQ